MIQNKFDQYTLELKSKLDRNYLSPLFIRYANLLYANDNFEECISVCITGLSIFPNYFTAKLILLKAFLKAEYLNESEILFAEVKIKLTNRELRDKYALNIQNLKAITKQEKIYYPKSFKSKSDFKIFSGNFQFQENLFTEFTINDYFSDDDDRKIPDSKDFQLFLTQFENYHFKKINKKENELLKPAQDTNSDLNSGNEIFNRIKIVTETLADIYVSQKNYKEAFEAYNFLIRAGSGNTKRIEEKLNELERNMISSD